MEKIKKLEFEKGVVYCTGVQCFDKDSFPITDRNTGEVKEIEMKKWVLHFIGELDPFAFGSVGIYGTGTFTIKVDLDKICYLFGKNPNEFNSSDLYSLEGCAVHLDYIPNGKGKAVLRSITNLSA